MAIYTIENGYQKDKRRSFTLISLVFLAVAGLLIYFYASSRSPLASSGLSQNSVAAASEQTDHKKLINPLPWPKYGQAAYGVVNEGVLAESDNSAQSVPVASLAKIITALAVLEKKPLAKGQQGPYIILTEQDEKLYQDYIAKNGTVVPVKAGVRITQYQALQAMLMPSANNIADTLAIWAFGSVEAYNDYANNMLRELGFSNTSVADASGYSPLTKSTAEDMVQLGILYIKNPLLRDIASQTEANIPFAGVIRNYNSSINEDGVLGLKIGFTDEAGRTFLVADVRDDNINHASVVAVMGASSLPLAMQDAKTLLESGNLSHDLIVKK